MRPAITIDVPAMLSQNVEASDEVHVPVVRNVQVGPNPSRAGSALSLKADFMVTGLDIYNVRGQKVLTRQVDNARTAILPMDALAGGLYILRAKDRDGNAATAKFIILP